MPSKHDSSQSSQDDSSPEKISNKNVIQPRRSLRELPGRTIRNQSIDKVNHSPMRYDLNHSPMRHEVNHSPMRPSLEHDESLSDQEIQSPRAYHVDVNGRKYYPESALYRDSPSPPLCEPTLEANVPQRHKTPAPLPPLKPATGNNKFISLILIISVVIAVICMFATKGEKTSVENLGRNCSHFSDLKIKFPTQDPKLFKSLRIGVEGAMEGSPLVTSLFSTDAKVLNNILDEVVEASKKCIGQIEDPLTIPIEELNSKSIENFKAELTKRVIMIVRNVEESDDVTSLHSFCDTHNPLVANSIIFLTIKVPSPPTGKPVEFITEFLEQRWENLPSNKRGPLITRLTDQTFFLKP